MADVGRPAGQRRLALPGRFVRRQRTRRDHGTDRSGRVITVIDVVAVTIAIVDRCNRRAVITEIAVTVAIAVVVGSEFTAPTAAAAITAIAVTVVTVDKTIRRRGAAGMSERPAAQIRQRRQLCRFVDDEP